MFNFSAEEEREGIKGFFGKYRFLSNFYPAREAPGGKTVEHAYQAAKAVHKEDEQMILCAATPGKAKKIGQKISVRPDWKYIKESIMLGLLRAKFRDSCLREKLLATSPLYLE